MSNYRSIANDLLQELAKDSSGASAEHVARAAGELLAADRAAAEAERQNSTAAKAHAFVTELLTQLGTNLASSQAPAAPAAPVQPEAPPAPASAPPAEATASQPAQPV